MKIVLILLFFYSNIIFASEIQNNFLNIQKTKIQRVQLMKIEQSVGKII
jgi:hypothetical protein